MKERKEQFQKLLEEAGLHGKYVYTRCNESFDTRDMQHRAEDSTLTINFSMLLYRSSFSDFAQKHGRDERFKNVEKMRERESLFNEYLLEVRKREKEEKTAKREQVFLFH